MGSRVGQYQNNWTTETESEGATHTEEAIKQIKLGDRRQEWLQHRTEEAYNGPAFSHPWVQHIYVFIDSPIDLALGPMLTPFDTKPC